MQPAQSDDSVYSFIHKVEYHKTVLKITRGVKFILKELLSKLVDENFKGKLTLKEFVHRLKLPFHPQFGNATEFLRVLEEGDLRLVSFCLFKLSNKLLANCLRKLLEIRNELLWRYDNREMTDRSDTITATKVDALLQELNYSAGQKSGQIMNELKNCLQNQKCCLYEDFKSGIKELKKWYDFDPDGFKNDIGFQTGKIKVFYLVMFLFDKKY